MPSLELRAAKQTYTKDSDECVLLIEAEPDDAARILDELGSATDERLRVEWVAELSNGIERLRNGGVGALVLDLTLPDSQGVETFDKVFQAAPRAPILILGDADSEEMARQVVQRGSKTTWLRIKPIVSVKEDGAHDDGSPWSGSYLVRK